MKGMIIISNRDKEIVNLKCDRCGEPIQIKYGSWRRNKNGPHLCRACRGKAESERINNLPPDEKKAYLESKNNAISKGWRNQSDDMKQHVSYMRKEEWKDKDRRDKHAKMLKDRYKNYTPERQQQQIKSLLEGQTKFWSNPDNKDMQSDKARDRWYSQPKEEQERILSALNNGRIEFYENITPEDLESMRRKQSESMRRNWRSISNDDKEKRILKLKDGVKYNIINQRKSPNKNELAIMNLLKMNGIPYELRVRNTKKHPEFDKLFPKNPNKPGSIVIPYHEWDFALYTRSGKILLDVDGSIHNPNSSNNMVTDTNGNKFVLYEQIAFKDSQRPYQTDGLPAYAVRCLDDKITKDTPVLNIVDNKEMALYQFINYLYYLNLPNTTKR
jgi:hypothetical protein